jgi:hypothetical protein
MNEAAGAAVDEGQRSRNQRMFGCSKPNLLRKGQTKDCPRLAVVRYARAGRAVDQFVKFRHSAQGFPNNGERKRMVGRRKIARRRSGSIQSLAAPQDGIKHLQRGSPRPNTFNAWHQRFR